MLEGLSSYLGWSTADEIQTNLELQAVNNKLNSGINIDLIFGPSEVQQWHEDNGSKKS